MKHLNRTYKGRHIYECDSAEHSAYSHNGRWIVQTYHQTGTGYADELCPHFHSLAGAREWINDRNALLNLEG